MHPTIFYPDVRTDDQVPHGPRGQNFIGPSGRHHPRRDVHRDSTDLTIAQLDLAGMQAQPDLDSEAAQFVAEGSRTADCAPRAVEGYDNLITGHCNQSTVELLGQSAGQLIMYIQQFAPAPVAQPPGLLSGAYYVGEQNGCQNPPGIRDAARAPPKCRDVRLMW
jgi:hypothetical protein